MLAREGLSFRKTIAQTDFDLEIEADECNLGNLIADSIRWYINKHDYDPGDPVTRVAVSVISNGLIRDDIVRGKTGKVAVCDVFRAIPLGIGMDDTMGYPLITFYLHPSEVKKGIEILTSIYPIKGTDYFLQISGARFTYNPNRMIFDRVTEIWLGNEEEGYIPLDYSKSNKTLLRVAADIYNATFLKIVPEKYKGKLGRNVVEANWNPYKLLRRGTYVTWGGFLVFLIVLFVVLIVFRLVSKKIRR